jgi:hypothetical protein
LAAAYLSSYFGLVLRCAGWNHDLADLGFGY